MLDAMMRDVFLSDRRLTHSACLIAALFPLVFSDGASADEAGVSFWLQGQFGSFAAAPSNPGWSFESTFYHATAAASPSTSFARGGGFQVGMKSPTDFVMVTPTYVFATPVLGGQAAVGMTALYGRNTTSVSANRAGGSRAIGKPFRLRPRIRRLVSGRDVEMESGRAQFHDLRDDRYSRRRLRSHPSGEHGTGPLGNRRRRRLHLFERASRI